MKLFKNVSAISSLGLLVPVLAFAQEGGEGAGSFVNSFSLWTAVIIGVLASMFVLMNAQKMSGGIFGTVLMYFGVGMLLVVLGFLAVVVPPWASMEVIMRTHDIAFILGYIVMAIGAVKLSGAIGPKPGMSTENNS